MNSQNLNRDDQSFYELIVEAYDRGEPSLPQGICSVNITIVDVNDKDPEFPQPEPKAEVEESKNQ